MLRGMKYVHSAGIMHRDIKPSNLLINNEGDLKVADFGLAIGQAGESHQLISYVVTRWYRAPELLLDKKDYSFAVDMWSIGCILAEMLGCKPLFRGNSSRHQLHLILSVLGKPSREDVVASANPRYHDMLNKMEDRRSVGWAKLYPDAPVQALDLLDKLLSFNPERRPTCEEALAHPYLEELRIPHDEPEHRLNFSYVTEDLKVDDIWRQIDQDAKSQVDEEADH
jgi:mitogen-activated protein kinase 1/3